MPLLLKRRDEVKKHWHAAAHEIGNILPGAAEAYRPLWHEPAGTAATLVSHRFQHEHVVGHTGLRIPLVPLIGATSEESPEYWASWHDEWRPEDRASSNKLQFRSSSIVIYRGVAGSPKVQLFRAEWAGVQRVENKTDIFQGSGAAHPHWHFDALQGYLDDIGRQVKLFDRESEATQGLVADRFRDFGDAEAEQELAGLFSSPALQLPTEGDLKWTGIHLAAAARWADEVWPGPDGPHDTHARGPASPEALRRWLVSCVRYVRAEINKL